MQSSVAKGHYWLLATVGEWEREWDWEWGYGYGEGSVHMGWLDGK